MKRLLLVFLMFLLPGCACLEKSRRVDILEKENLDLRCRLAELRVDKQREAAQVQEKSRQLTELEKAKADLEESLKHEISSYQAKLEMTESGLVVTFVAEVFFDSGKAVVRGQGKDSLRRVAEILNRDVPDSSVAIEGHTDNEPIQKSSWKSNWELSSMRALAVVHFFVDQCSVDPRRLSANGYGEYRPVAGNDSSEGRKKNRRVEILIVPSKVSKEEPE